LRDLIIILNASEFEILQLCVQQLKTCLRAGVTGTQIARELINNCSVTSTASSAIITDFTDNLCRCGFFFGFLLGIVGVKLSLAASCLFAAGLLRTFRNIPA
jgi:hypothetical protein